MQTPMTDRTASELQLEHYQIEKALASKLMAASKDERRHLYTEVYDELFRRVPHHPMLIRKASERVTRAVVQEQMRLVAPYLRADSRFLEIGPGDCALAFKAAAIVAEVYGVDVSDEITRRSSCPPNFRLIVSDGCSVPVAQDSIDFAYSNQLMEHLHPDDAFDQLQNIFNALAPGGTYLCVTPNRLSGPHDISKCFDSVATGFHLHEYTAGELASLFAKAGFAHVRILVRVRGRHIGIPLPVHTAIERLVAGLPARARRRMAVAFPLRILFANIFMTGQK